MTYPWFYYQAPLYAKETNISFPGTYLASHINSPSIRKNKAFTFKQFLDANIHTHRIYIGGKLNPGVADNIYDDYDIMPVGLVSQFLQHEKIIKAFEYSMMCFAAWERILTFLPKLPPESKYSEYTWEWTIGRDFKDRLTDTSAYFLQLAIKEEQEDIKPLIDSLYFLETALAFEGLDHAPSALLKNTGLAHIHLLQNPLAKDKKKLPKPTKDVFNSTIAIHWPSKQ
jgi:hypothetical protein